MAHRSVTGGMQIRNVEDADHRRVEIMTAEEVSTSSRTDRLQDATQTLSWPGSAWPTSPTPEIEREVRVHTLKRKAGTDILFPGKRSGGYRSIRKLEIDFKVWGLAVGKDITLHDLRSTFATLMVNADAHPAVLQA